MAVVSPDRFTGIWELNLGDKYQKWKSATNTCHLPNKRSKDLGALLGSCSWSDIANFLQTCIKNSLLQTKSIEIWV